MAHAFRNFAGHANAIRPIMAEDVAHEPGWIILVHAAALLVNGLGPAALEAVGAPPEFRVLGHAGAPLAGRHRWMFGTSGRLWAELWAQSGGLAGVELQVATSGEGHAKRLAADHRRSTKECEQGKCAEVGAA